MKSFIEFMKVFLLLFIIPFVLVWMAWLLSAMSFSIKDAFSQEGFWFVSTLYWFFSLVMAGALTEDENSKPKRRYKSGSF
jgi:hypothetical protein